MGTRARLLIGVALAALTVGGAFAEGGALLPVAALPALSIPDGPRPHKRTNPRTPVLGARASAQASLSTVEVILQPELGDKSLLQDTYLFNFSPDTNYGANGGFQVGLAYGGNSRALMRWDLSDLPIGAQVQEARLELYAFLRSHVDRRIDISIFKMLRSWVESSATWNLSDGSVPWGAAGCTAPGADHGVAAVTTTSIMPTDPVPGWHTWYITSLVQDWVDDPGGNHGMLLASVGTNARCDFFTSEAGSVVFRPRLVIQYSPTPPTSTPSATPTGPTLTPTPTATPTLGPTATPTETPVSWIDTSQAVQACCMHSPGCRFEGDSTGKPNNAEYYGTLTWAYTGPEDVYILHKTVVSDLFVTVEYGSGDLDVFLLYENLPGQTHPSALLQWHDTGFRHRNLPPGTYYIVVDGYQGSMGPYLLTLICEGEPTPTPTITPTPSPTNTPANSFYPLLFKMPTPTPTVTPTFLPYDQGINCGSTESYQATDGYWYAPDKPYTQGSWGWAGEVTGVSSTDRGIALTTDDPLYQTQRWGMNAYRFTVPSGRYEVLLRFAEIVRYGIYPGSRVFDLYAEGQLVLPGFDIRSNAGLEHAFDVTREISVVDGVLDIGFVQQTPANAPAINGIRVHRLGGMY